MRPRNTPAARTAPVDAGCLPDLPRLVPLQNGKRVFGPSRSTWYRLGEAGHIRLAKVGRGTFLDTASVLAYLASLPTIPTKPAT